MLNPITPMGILAEKTGNMIKLAAFDMDGVLFEHFNFWYELHKRFGTYKKGKELTEKYKRNNYEKLVKEVVHKLWKGKSALPYFDLVKKSRYLPGAKETFSELKKRKIKTAIITSGPRELALRAQKELGIDFIFTNELVIKDNVITGEFKWPVADGKNEKVKALKELCNKLNINLNEVAYVGDNYNDIGAFKIVGLAIAFNSEEEEVKKYAKIVIDKKDLREILNFF